MSAAGKGANLLLNVGPQPNGELPAAAVERMKAMGEWLAVKGETVYGTEAGDIAEQEWGVTTRKGERLFVHIFESEAESILLDLRCEVLSAKVFGTDEQVAFEQTDKGVILKTGSITDSIDYIIEVVTK